MAYSANPERYEKMQYRRCGKSGLCLPPLALGFWHNFGEKSNYENTREIVLSAFDAGITHFDLANNYGPPPGSAEVMFGHIFKREMKAYRDEVVISTKAGYPMWAGPYGDGGSKKYLLGSLEQSLKRMQLDYVDIFYHHRPDPETPMEESMDALATAVKQGKALYVGISKYSPEETKKACRLLEGMGVRCLVQQPKYSIFNRMAEELETVLKEEGMGAVVFSPLDQGLLTGRYLQGIPGDSRAASGAPTLPPAAITEERLEKVRKLQEMAQNRGQTLAQMALAWVLEKDLGIE